MSSRAHLPQRTPYASSSHGTPQAPRTATRTSADRPTETALGHHYNDPHTNSSQNPGQPPNSSMPNHEDDMDSEESDAEQYDDLSTAPMASGSRQPLVNPDGITIPDAETDPENPLFTAIDMTKDDTSEPHSSKASGQNSGSHPPTGKTMVAGPGQRQMGGGNVAGGRHPVAHPSTMRNHQR